MKKYLLLLLCFLPAFSPKILYGQEYSLNDLYRLALERSETIKIAGEDLYISEREKDRALSTLIPTLSAFGNHTRYSEEKSQGAFLLQPEHTNEWGLRLDQTFSLGGKEFTALKIAEEGIEKSGFDLEAVKEDFLMNVAAEYFIVLRSKKALDIAMQNVERLTKHRDAAKKRLEVGEVTKTVLLRAEAELAGAKSELIKAENNLRIAKTRLAKSVNISGDYDVKEPRPGIDFDMPAQGLSGQDFLTENCKLSTVDCLVETALSERAEIKSAVIQMEVEKSKVTFEEGSYWPDLSIEGVYSREENEPSSTFGLDERIYGVLKLNFPFFEGGLRRAEVGQAKARLRQAEYRLSNLKRSIGVEVENSFLIVKRESAVLTQVQAEVEFALDNYNSVTKQFKYGLADSIDIMDANTLLVTAERELATAKYAYQLSVLRLRRTTGQLLKRVTDTQSALAGKQ
jgi:outer membrane protein